MTFLPSDEKIIETKKCQLSGKEFLITNKDRELLNKISPVFSRKNYLLPNPTLCPEERQRRRLSFRNERKLYKSKCSKTGREIISIYSPDKNYIVYDQKVWWSDDWHASEYWQNFDFNRGFFDQFKALFERAPKLSLLNINCENSEYTNFTHTSKNCYLCVGTTNSEGVLYSNFVRDVKNIVDSTFTYESELIYYGMDVTRCYHSFFIKNCVQCQDCFGVEECESCHHCIGCYGLKNKEYHIFNKPVSPEEFQKVWKNALTHGGSIKILQDLKKLREKQYVRNMHLINCENCFWDQIDNGKNGYMCFDAKNIDNARYAYFSPKNIHVIDCAYTAPLGLEFCGECNSSVWVSYSFGTFHFWHGSHNLYSISCQWSDDLFWCVSVKKWKNMILNKVYSRQEYETLCGKIIEHMTSTWEWWEFFPISLSAFWYNETVAQEYFPVSEDEAREKWWKWHEGENKNTYIWEHYKPLPIDQYDEKNVWYEIAQKNIDSLLSGILECEVTHKPYKIIKQELVFYIENHLPIPTKHPDERHRERMSLRNPRELHERTCPECQRKMVTTYRPERPEKVVCEECYKRLTY